MSNYRSELVVLASDSLAANQTIQDTKARFEELASITCWLIDEGSALAVLDRTAPNIGPDGRWENPGKLRPFDRLLNEVTVPDVLGIFGSFPSARFFVAFVFPKKEEPYRMTSASLWTRQGLLRLKLHTYRDLAPAGFAAVKSIFSEWLDQATQGVLHSEKLTYRELLISRFAKPAEHPMPRQLGWEITFANPSEVFFPWLELFFRLRRQLPKGMRVSLEFSD